MALDDASRDSAKLHSKYLSKYMTAKLHLKSKEQSLQSLLKLKWLYYNGKMTAEQIEAEGWEYDPFHGMKVLKGDMDRKALVDTLKEIMSNIQWRHQNIGNMIKWRQFVSGA